MSEISSNERDEDRDRVKKMVEQLGEHFDTVQIFATRHVPGDDNGTICVNRGSGNWCARYGQITEWVKYEDERIRACARKAEE